jgi:hypothetical protein
MNRVPKAFAADVRGITKMPVAPAPSDVVEARLVHVSPPLVEKATAIGLLLIRYVVNSR